MDNQKKEQTRRFKNRKNSTSIVVIFSWILVLFWMAVIFWFSSQPSQESVRWSVGTMQLGRELISNWEWVGILLFIIVYHIFLIWLTRMQSSLIVKGSVFVLFLLFSVVFAGVLYAIVRPRLASSGIFELNRWVIHWYLRKYAHFFIYLILGGVLKNALTLSSVKGWKAIMIAIVISFLYAVSDEIHQYFVPGRMPLVLDIIIDTAGATVGVIVYSILYRLYRLLKKE
jgi:VanZ family protein